MTSYAQRYREHFEQIVDDITHGVIARAGGTYATLSYEQLRPRAASVADLLGRDLEMHQGEPRYFGENYEQIGYDRATEGYTIEDLQRGIVVIADVVRSFFRQQLADRDELFAAIERLNDATNVALMVSSSSFNRAYADVLNARTTTILQLSAPIIPLYDEILLVPLVGTLDPERATQITESTLEAIVAYQASIIVIDISGVTIVDTATANHLLQMAKAVHLLGSRIVLVGLQSSVAQTLVQIGVELGNIVTLATLQDGLEYALQTRGLAITAEVQNVASS